MVSSRLTKRRQRVPLPYVCASKKKWFPFNKRRRGIPKRVNCTIFLQNGGCPGPTRFALIQFSLTQREKYLTWYGHGAGDGVNGECSMHYDAIHGGYTLAGTFTSEPGLTPPIQGHFATDLVSSVVGRNTVIEFSQLITVGDWRKLTVSVSYATGFGNEKD